MSEDKKRVLIIANELSPYVEFTDFAEEYHALAIIVKKLPFVVSKYRLTFEVVFIIHEVYL